MDQFTAHLDRGWDLAQRGDAVGAKASAKRAMALESDSPEAHNLMGFSCALRGESEEALEMYLQAIALDDAFLEPVLNAAELCIQALGDAEAGLAFCKDALPLADGNEEITDVLLLQVDALLALGRQEEARKLRTRIPPPPYRSPEHSFLVGRALFETGDTRGAEKLLIEAAREDTENPDIPYYLGLIQDKLGEGKASTEFFLRSLRLELSLAKDPNALSPPTFATAVSEALAHLPPRLRKFVNPEEVYISNCPGVEVVVEGVDPRAPLLLEPLEESSSLLRVFVYQHNVERLSRGRDSVLETLRHCLAEEIAAFVCGESELAVTEDIILN